MRRRLGLCFAVMNFLPVVAVAADLPAGLGPLRLGTPFEDVRRDLPDIAWVDGNPYPHSGKPRQLAAASGIVIADLSFSASLVRGHHGGYSIELQHEAAATDADDCERRARAVFIAIEPQTGPMEPSGGLLPGEYAESIGARSRIKRVQTLDETLRKPVPREKLRGRQPARRWLRGRTPDGGNLRETRFQFQMDYARSDGPRACRIRLDAVRDSSPPPPVTVDWAKLSPSRAPSIALRHLLVSRLGARHLLPANGVAWTLSCSVERNSGAVEHCELPPPPADLTAADALHESAMRRAAVQLAREYRFDIGKLVDIDRDDPVPLQVDIPIRLRPEDVRTLTHTESAVPLRSAGFKWASGASPGVLERLYPTRALRAGEQSAVALVCRIEEDYSPVCAPIQQEPRPAPDFEWAALEILTHYRASPTATDGTSTIGRMVLQRLEFRVED